RAPPPIPGQALSQTANKPPVPAPAARPGPAPVAGEKVEGPAVAGIVDTIEAIIIGLGLALTFRGFFVEAFGVPAGSMAPTLLGAHFNVICPKCGYAFKRDGSPHAELLPSTDPRHPGLVVLPVGDRAELTNNRIVPSDTDAPIICPNCQYAIDPDSLP